MDLDYWCVCGCVKRQFDFRYWTWTKDSVSLLTPPHSVKTAIVKESLPGGEPGLYLYSAVCLRKPLTSVVAPAPVSTHLHATILPIHLGIHHLVSWLPLCTDSPAHQCLPLPSSFLHEPLNLPSVYCLSGSIPTPCCCALWRNHTHASHHPTGFSCVCIIEEKTFGQVIVWT